MDCSIPAMLLAAGLGTRLSPLTDTIPKCLVPIHKTPLLGYWLEMLGKAGLGPIIVNTHHHAAAVEAFVANNPWRDRVVLAYEQSLLGTGGTLLANREALNDGSFFVAHADNLSRFPVEEFLGAHERRPGNCVMTMMLFHSPTPTSCGIVELDADGIVTAFHEKVKNPPGNLANGAVYVMEPEVLDMLAEIAGDHRDISLDLIPRCLGRINSWVNQDYHRDIGTPESYAKAEAEYNS